MIAHRFPHLCSPLLRRPWCLARPELSGHLLPRLVRPYVASLGCPAWDPFVFSARAKIYALFMEAPVSTRIPFTDHYPLPTVHCSGEGLRQN
jgi:hypothetical protein